VSLLPSQERPGPSVPLVPTNAKALLSVSTLWAPAVAVVLAVLARREIRRTGEAGWGLATTGLWIGVARLVAPLLLVASLAVLAGLVLLAVALGWR